MTTNKVGIFGGTFNPVHKAHVAAAEAFIESFRLDLLYIIPNRIPPLKESGCVSGEDRTEMLKIAFSGNDKILISDMELKREGTSYTCDTVAELRALHPESKLFLLTGDDWADGFDRWKNYRFILENVTLVIAARSGNDIGPALDRLEALTGVRPFELKNQKIELSSTEFRANPEKHLLPNGVYEYIERRGLYGL